MKYLGVVCVLGMVSMYTACAQQEVPNLNENITSDQQSQAQERESVVQDAEGGDEPSLQEEQPVLDIPQYTVTNNGRDEFDTKIIRTIDGREEVVVESTRQLFGVSRANPTQSYELEAIDPTGTILLFFAYLPNTDAGAGDWYIFDTKTNSSRPLDVINKMKSGFMRPVFNETQTMAIYAEGDEENTGYGVSRTLYVLEPFKDEVTEITTLPEGESFNEGMGGVNTVINVEWLSDTKIAADIFRQTENATYPKELIERRVFSLPVQE